MLVAWFHHLIVDIYINIRMASEFNLMWKIQKFVEPY